MNKPVAQLFAVVAAVVGFASFGATTYVWTGAEDVYWTNAANWTVGGAVATQHPGVPWSEITTETSGSYKYDTVSAAGKARQGEYAEFGACSGATTIDFDGLYSVCRITVAAGAPTYTFGASSDQTLPLETYGRLILASGLENMPVMTAVFGLGRAAYETTPSGSTGRDSFVYIENNSGKELTLGNYGNYRTSNKSDWSFANFNLSGTGNIRITGSAIRDDASWKPGLTVDINVPKLTVAGTMDTIARFTMSKKDGNVEILKDCALVWNSGLNGPFLGGNNSGCSITGAGVVRFARHTSTAGTNRNRIYALSDCELKIATAFELYGTGTDPDLYMYDNGTSKGTVCFSGENRFAGSIAFIDGDKTCKGNEAGLPTNTLVKFSAPGTFAAAFATNTTLTRTFAVAEGRRATVSNAGSTNLTATITVTPLEDGTTATLCGKAVSQPLVLDATYADGLSVTLAIDGASVVSPTAATLANAAAIRLMGGTLDASAVKNWSPAVPVTFDTGAATVVVPDGETYTLPSLTRTDSAGTVNFVCGTGRVKVTGATVGSTPAGVTVNGFAAEIRDGGLVAPIAPSTDLQIAAKGDTVPNEPTKTVGITTAGTVGNDTVAAEVTAVKELVHISDADATVEIGAGTNFTANAVRLAGFAGNLNVGTADDAGIFGTAGADVTLKNDDLSSDLTIRAPLADRARVIVTETTKAPVVAGGSTTSNALIVTGSYTYHPTTGNPTAIDQASTLKVSGERSLYLDFATAGTNLSVASSNPADWPTLLFDGAKDVVLGERGLHACYGYRNGGYNGHTSRGRIVITNSLLRSDDINRTNYPHADNMTGEKWTLDVGNRAQGYLEIQADAIISNRVHIGSPYGGHRGLAVGRQTGGSVAALGDFGRRADGSAAYEAGSAVAYFRCHGYFQFEGGSFTSLGDFMIGHYAACGVLRQTGGAFAIVRHPGDTSKNAPCWLRIGDGSEGDGRYWMSGGTCDVPFGVRMSGGYWKNQPSYASVTVDGTATLDVHNGEIYLIDTSSSPLGDDHTGFFNINGGAVVRAAGFTDLSKSGAVDTAPENRHAVVGFNGGTFKTGASKKAIFHTYNSGVHRTAERTVDHVVVYAGGMTVDTDGQTGNFIDVPLEGPTGGGVTAIDYTPSATMLSYGVPPVVTITGDGEGATAEVDWDIETRTIRRVVITSSGFGYTTATAEFRVGQDSTAKLWFTRESVPCTIAANANTGAFTKTGEGDLTLESTNTWGGATILAGGKLVIAHDKAYPAGSTLQPQGGTLEVAAGVTLPSPLTVDVSALDPETRHYPVELKGDAPAAPAVVLTGTNADKWTARFANGKLRLAARRGFALVVQ